MDLSKLSDADLFALKAGDLSKVSDAGLLTLKGAPAPEPISRTDKVLKGMRDPVDAGAQLLTNILPKGVVEAGNAVNNWLADKTGLVGKLPEGGVDQQVREQEKAYQAQRAAAGESGFDGYRTIGNVISPANLGVGRAVGALGTAATLPARVAQGAASGGIFGALTPVAEGDFKTEKLKQIGIGTGTGAILPLALAGAARVIKPNTRADVELLMKEGVTPTPGQILGGRWQTTEDKLTSLPIVGDAISSSRKQSLDEFNRAAYARALKTTGGTLPDEVGRAGVAAVRKQLGDKYDALLPTMGFQADQQFAQELGNLQTMAKSLAPTEAKKFASIMNEHLSKLSPNGGMQGETFKTVESALGEDIKRFAKSPDAYQQELADALREAQRVFRTGLERSNPVQAGELGKINAGYAAYARIRDAASRQGAAEGKFTPAQLAAAVRAGDKSVGKGAYAQGTAMMQDLSDAGKNVLASQYPDSGTVGRLLTGAGAGGAAYLLNPGLLTGAGAAALPYLPGGRQLMATLLARRPGFAKPVADAVRNATPLLAPGAIPMIESAQQP
jgi:hypothetical protein